MWLTEEIMPSPLATAPLSSSKKVPENLQTKLDSIQKQIDAVKEQRLKLSPTKRRKKLAPPIDHNEKPKKHFQHPKLEYVYGEIIYSPYLTPPLDPYPEEVFSKTAELRELKRLGVQTISELPVERQPYNPKVAKNTFIRDVINYKVSFLPKDYEERKQRELERSQSISLDMSIDIEGGGGGMLNTDGSFFAPGSTSAIGRPNSTTGKSEDCKTEVLLSQCARGGPQKFKKELKALKATHAKKNNISSKYHQSITVHDLNEAANAAEEAAQEVIRMSNKPKNKAKRAAERILEEQKRIEAEEDIFKSKDRARSIKRSNDISRTRSMRVSSPPHILRRNHLIILEEEKAQRGRGRSMSPSPTVVPRPTSATFKKMKLASTNNKKDKKDASADSKKRSKKSNSKNQIEQEQDDGNSLPQFNITITADGDDDGNDLGWGFDTSELEHEGFSTQKSAIFDEFAGTGDFGSVEEVDDEPAGSEAARLSREGTISASGARPGTSLKDGVERGERNTKAETKTKTGDIESTETKDNEPEPVRAKTERHQNFADNIKEEFPEYNPETGNNDYADDDFEDETTSQNANAKNVYNDVEFNTAGKAGHSTKAPAWLKENNDEDSEEVKSNTMNNSQIITDASTERESITDSISTNNNVPDLAGGGSMATAGSISIAEDKMGGGESIATAGSVSIAEDKMREDSVSVHSEAEVAEGKSVSVEGEVGGADDKSHYSQKSFEFEADEKTIDKVDNADKHEVGSSKSTESQSYNNDFDHESLVAESKNESKNAEIGTKIEKKAEADAGAGAKVDFNVDAKESKESVEMKTVNVMDVESKGDERERETESKTESKSGSKTESESPDKTEMERGLSHLDGIQHLLDEDSIVSGVTMTSIKSQEDHNLVPDNVSIERDRNVTVTEVTEVTSAHPQSVTSEVTQPAALSVSVSAVSDVSAASEQQQQQQQQKDTPIAIAPTGTIETHTMPTIETESASISNEATPAVAKTNTGVETTEAAEVIEAASVGSIKSVKSLTQDSQVSAQEAQESEVNQTPIEGAEKEVAEGAKHADITNLMENFEQLAHDDDSTV